MINVTLGKIHMGAVAAVGDPCYQPGTAYTAVLHTLRPGSWDAALRLDEAGVVRALTLGIDLPVRVARYQAALSVDSGQIGVFDEDYYRRSRSGSQQEDWYARVMETTLDESDHGGTLDGQCAVCRAGMGDGSYPLLIGYDATDRIVLLNLDFSDEEEA